MPVPDVEDLVLLKIDAGSHSISVTPRNSSTSMALACWTRVDQRVGEMPEQLREAWEAFKRFYDR